MTQTGWEISFELSTFSDKYQRNNKRGGLKNLRCFPSCADLHRERGFCGRSVFVTIKKDGKPLDSTDRVLVRSEFVIAETSSGFKVGDKVQRGVILEKDRSKEEPIKPFIRGELVTVVRECGKTEKTIYEFNRDHKGWHYGWASNKHTCNFYHCLQVYVLELIPGSNDTYECRCVARSPSFMLFCRRRRRFKVVPTAPVCQPSSTSQGSRRDGVNGDENVMASQQNARYRVVAKQEGIDDEAATSNNVSRKRKIEVLTDLRDLDSNNKTMKKERKVVSNKRKKLVDMQRLNSILRTVAEALSHYNGEQEQPNADIFELPPTSLGEADRLLSERRKRIVRDLALYLINERGFTKSIQGLWMSDSERPGRSKEYRAFVSVLERNIGGFLKIHNITLDDFDRIFGAPSAQTAAPDHESELTDSTTSTPTFKAVTQHDLLLSEGWDQFPDFMIALGSGGEQVATALEGWESNWDDDINALFAPPLPGKLFDDPFMAPLPGNNLASTSASSSSSSSSPPPPPLSCAPAGDLQPLLPPTPELSEVPKGRKTGRKEKGVKENVYGAYSRLMSSKKLGKYIEEKNKEPVPSKPFDGTEPHVPNHEGTWEQSPEGSEEVARMRIRCGIPWVLSKMLEQQEKRFTISQTGHEVRLHFQSKLLSNGAFTSLLDNVERQFSMALPILTGLSSNWKNRAFVKGEEIHFEITMGLRRITRVNYLCPQNSDILVTNTSLFFYSERESKYIEVQRVQQKAHRVAICGRGTVTTIKTEDG